MSIGHGHDSHNAVPVVSFSVVDATALEPPAVDNQVAVQYGFNDGSNWPQAAANHNLHPVASTSGTAQLLGSSANGGTSDNNNSNSASAADAQRDSYLRYLQPMEADLAKQVEYDMDEHDKTWLDGINNERKQSGTAPVSYEAFEIIIDKLEKEWFDLQRMIPKKARDMPLEDGFCAICDDGECENSNAIVFCDGCNLAVHQDCYGVPYIPEGQWLCRKCTVSPDKPVSCVLCPNAYGAFKQTTTGHWAHLLCAIWIPETGVANTVYMEPIDGVDHISKSRWKLQCSLCRHKTGAYIQCANRNCFLAFHVTCAREKGLELKMKPGSERGELKMFCEKHGGLPQPPPPSSDDAPATAAAALTSSARKLKSLKSKQAYKKTYKVGLPVVPQYVFDKVSDYVERLKIAKKQEFMNSLCRYWSLKRQQRRGAPLLKRLHLEPWTASGSTQQATEKEKAKKLQLMRLLRNDLEKVRMLVESVRKREKKKLSKVNVVKSVVDNFVWSKEKIMRDVLDKIVQLDVRNWFTKPVDATQVIDYYDVVKSPMTLDTMRFKIDTHVYSSVKDFTSDLDLIVSNAILYNGKDHNVSKHAIKLRERSVDFLKDLEQIDEPESDVNVLTTYLGMVLTDEVVEDLFEYSGKAALPGQAAKPPSGEQSSTNKNTSAAAPTATVTANGKKVDKGKQKQIEAEADGNVAAADKIVEKGVKQGLVRKAAKDEKESKKRTAEQAKLDEKRSSRSTKMTESKTTSARGDKTAKTRTSAGATALNSNGTRRRGRPSRQKGPTPDDSESVSSSDMVATDDAPEVEDVGAKQSFKMFNSGWMLPEGSTRRRSSVLPPSNDKKAKPRASTASKEVEIGKKKVAANGQINDGDQGQASGEEADQSENERPAKATASSKKARGVADKGKGRQEQGKTVDVGKKDVAKKETAKAPASRRKSGIVVGDKGQQEAKDKASTSENRSRKRAAGSGVEDGAAAVSQRREPKAKRAKTADADEDDVVIVGDDGKKGKKIKGGSRKSGLAVSRQKGKADAPRAADEDSSGETETPPFEVIDMTKEGLEEWQARFDKFKKPHVNVTKKNLDGTLVWAKLRGWPWWPGELMDENASDTPQSIRDRKPDDARGLLPVMFFDKNRSDDWLDRKTEMFMLGDDDEFDKLMRSPYQAYANDPKAKSRIKLPAKSKFATATAIHEAYYQARGAIDSD
ncbi:hypothetical protein ACM66B_003516 [Microbotryomycetes sp. NB124-2]